jgi:hypothetical protein
MDCPPDRALPSDQAASHWVSAGVTFPPGNYVSLIIPPETIYFGYCHVETGAQVTLSILDCSEGSRYTPTADGAAVVERIVEQILALCEIPDEPAGPFCPEGGETVAGPRELNVNGDIAVALPEGSFRVYRDPEKPRTVTICAVQENGVSMRYETLLSLNGCTILSTGAIDPDEIATARAIGTSCRIVRDTSNDLPTPVSSGIANSITPPDTGSAGLR